MPKRAYWEKCERGKLLRAVMADALPENVVILRLGSEQEARLALIEAGKRYCVARCGGCPLTREMTPPATT